MFNSSIVSSYALYWTAAVGVIISVFLILAGGLVEQDKLALNLLRSGFAIYVFSDITGTWFAIHFITRLINISGAKNSDIYDPELLSAKGKALLRTSRTYRQMRALILTFNVILAAMFVVPVLAPPLFPAWVLILPIHSILLIGYTFFTNYLMYQTRRLNKRKKVSGLDNKL